MSDIEHFIEDELPFSIRGMNLDKFCVEGQKIYWYNSSIKGGLILEGNVYLISKSYPDMFFVFFLLFGPRLAGWQKRQTLKFSIYASRPPLLCTTRLKNGNGIAGGMAINIMARCMVP